MAERLVYIYPGGVNKKGDMMECTNYRTTELISHMCKIMLNILRERLRRVIEEKISEEQRGFRKDKSTIQQILTLRLIAEEMQNNSRTSITVSLISRRPSTLYGMKDYGVH